MLIRLVIDPSRVWGWHARLIAALRSDGHEVDVAFSPEAARRPLPSAYALLEMLERIVARRPEPVYARCIEARDLGASASNAGESCDLRIDLTGRADATGPSDLALHYDDSDEDAAMLALCESRTPTLTIRNAQGDTVIAARPAIERPDALTRALEHVFARALTLCRAAGRDPKRVAVGSVKGAASGRPVSARKPKPFAVAASLMLASTIRARLAAKLTTAPRWRTGWRMNATDRVIETGRWPAANYAMLPDDGQRFFADPFPAWRDGACHLFVEEYPFATGKGVLSVATLDSDGGASAPRVILERPYHLSYPMIFARDGETWMIPETSAARTIELYRADSFPDRWAFERVLVENVIASDMTLLEQNGKLWLLGTLAEEGGSTWDGLCAFYADRLLGEWRPHPANPLLIDASGARPAGFAAHTARGLIRPVQDCRGRYGAALALARIDRLDREGFAQTVISRLPPDPRWGAVGAHTLNDAGGVEAVDWIA